MMKEIFISTTDGKFYGIADVVKGLAVHRGYVHLTNEFSKLRSHWWIITHVPTGLKIPFLFFEQKKDALTARKKLIEMGDWSRWKNATEVPKEVKMKVKKLQKEWNKI